jgi:hypothetical protein
MDEFDIDYFLADMESGPSSINIFIGLHPALMVKQQKAKESSDSLISWWNTEWKIEVNNFYSPLHPNVYIIPRDRPINLVDEFGDAAGYRQIMLPFSSTDFYVDVDEDELFVDLTDNNAFFRLGGISQLGYLVPHSKLMTEGHRIYYRTPIFPHTRGHHSLLTAVFADVILARNGLSFSKRAPIVLAAGSHDIAMPTGGDSVKRISPELDEEKSYAYVIERSGLHLLWQKYGFDLAEAFKWVNGEGLVGRFIDVIDKMSYTALDNYHLVHHLNASDSSFNEMIDLVTKQPLIMDVWQDVRIDFEREIIYFVDPERLYSFLLLRALEHKLLLYDSRSRALDFYLEKRVRVLYESGELTRDNLLTMSNRELETLLEQRFPNKILLGLLSPDDLKWKKFATKQEQLDFAQQLGDKVDHPDDVKGFKAGLDWLVASSGRYVPLYELITKEQKEKIEHCIEANKGFYVYYQED